MNTEHIERSFRTMGARMRVSDARTVGWQRESRYAIDIQQDRRGDYFEFRVPRFQRDVLDATVLQIKPNDRHLLLMVRELETNNLGRFLCGHDERAWFVAAVPGGASSIAQAMDALQPREVRNSIAHHQVTTRQRYRRKNRAFRRQGEWFFIPEPGLNVDPSLILRHEPIRRGGGKPHWVEELFQSGGETVYVCSKYPNGLLPDEYRKLIREAPGRRGWNWRTMRRDPGVYARGTVRHADHKVITLPFWHRVLMNTESQTDVMQHVAFLD